MKFVGASVFLGLAALGGGMAHAQKPVPPATTPRLPLTTVFRGEPKFQAIIAKAERENWRNLPLGERTIRVAREFVGTSYANYSLEVHDSIESPVANLTAMDCWTYYENSLGIARMLKYKPGPYTPQDLLQMVEIERYRNGICTGSYLSRMHHLEEVFHDNQRRGYAANITSRIPGAEKMHRQIREMTVQWKNYRYLRNNPSLIEPIGRIEAAVSNLPVYQIPKAKVRNAEKYLQNGDICAITSTDRSGYTSHVGMIIRLSGRAYFTHATSDREKGRMVVIDRPISDYVNGASKHAGIIVCRPNDVPQSSLWENNVARQ